MEVDNEIGSEHFPVIAKLKRGGPKRGRGKKVRKRERKLKNGRWEEKKLREFR